jgi:hypothetical protein
MPAVAALGSHRPGVQALHRASARRVVAELGVLAVFGDRAGLPDVTRPLWPVDGIPSRRLCLELADAGGQHHRGPARPIGTAVRRARIGCRIGEPVCVPGAAGLAVLTTDVGDSNRRPRSRLDERRVAGYTPFPLARCSIRGKGVGRCAGAGCGGWVEGGKRSSRHDGSVYLPCCW